MLVILQGFNLHECADSVSSLTGVHSKHSSDDGGVKEEPRPRRFQHPVSPHHADSLAIDIMHALFWVALIAAAFLLFGSAIFHQQRQAQEELLASEQSLGGNLGA
jgi:hypothetical protein